MNLGEVLGIIGLVVTCVGFGLTIWQLVRTANAAEASTEALESATRRMNLNHLLVLLPQLRMMESDLDSATADDDAKLAIRTLVSYSHAASQVASLLEGAADEQDTELIEKLRESARAASAAKSVLVTGTSKPLRQVVKVASQQINDMSAHAAGLVTQFQSKVG